MDRLGVHISSSDDANQKKYICDDSAITKKLCTTDQRGQFIINNDTNEALYAPIYTTKIDLKKPGSIHYPVNQTGYYCVSTFLSHPASEYTAAVVFQNAFGHLPATQIPKLTYFGFATLAYVLALGLWMFAYIKNRSDILPVQNYITAICVFLVMEMAVIWGYYEYSNIHGSDLGSKIYLVVLSFFNSFRISFTFFLLLIVCMGYGVVRPSLGNDMWKCRALAATHFVFAVAWTINSYIVPPDNTSPLLLLVVVPLSLTMTGFYVWILSSLAHTSKQLLEQKQHVKAQMYKNLWRILFGSILVIFAFFFINAMIFANQSSMEFVTRSWKIRWFLLDGWLNVVYFVDFCLIAFIWRPTANNRRFAMSTQLAQDENDAQEFEIGSLRGSFDEEDHLDFENDHVPNRQLASSPPPNYETSVGDKNKAEEFKDTKKGESAAAASSSGGASSSNAGHNQGVFSVADSDDEGNEYDKWDESDDEDEHATETAGLRKKVDRKND